MQPAPEIYAVWWAETEACADVSRSMDNVVFYEVPGVASFNASNGNAAGVYYADDRIVLAGNWRLHGPTVRHEMLYALIPMTGGHPREYFLHRCGNVVSCPDDGCRDQVGPFTWPAGIATLAPDSLIVETQVVPANLAVGAFSNRFAIVITARNPRDYPVKVALAGPSYDMRGFGFGLYELPVGQGSVALLNDPIYDDNARYFRANETKRAVYDFVVGGGATGATFGVGNYQVTGSYGASGSAPAMFTISGTP